MKAYNTSSYLVFEADQVLSQKDLNMAVSHLEEQDRIIRKSLTGIGISCGLELTFPVKNQVKISCGTVVTSLGFQINWNEKVLTHYKPAKLSDQFLAPDYKEEAYLENIFKHSSQYGALKKIYDLLPPEASDSDKILIPDTFFEDKLIILLLEVTLVDEKNCVTTNCDDKGKRLEFNLRPIAVPQSELANQLFPQYPSYNFPKLTFPRYNVPFNDILTPDKVLENFSLPFNTAFIKNLSDVIAKIHNEYKTVTKLNLTILNDSKVTIEKVLKSFKGTVNIQYFWDWISDIVAAYNEIKSFKLKDFSFCCVDESLFPFHIVLGGDDEQSMFYRTPYFATGNSSAESKKNLNEFKLLFEKLAHIISSFKVGKNLAVRITPSKLGDVKLSEKAIPYYYDEILSLRDKWNPKLTAEKQSDSILSYHSLYNLYSNKNEVKNPLLYELEPYTFFRIEGHIGKNYQDALADILKIQQVNQLPFKVIALNAVQLEDLPMNLADEETDWGYMELDYDLVRRNWENVIGKIIEWLEFNQGTIKNHHYITDKGFFDQYIKYLKRGRNMMYESLTAFLKVYYQFIPVYEKIEDLSIQYREAVQNAQKEDPRFDEDFINHLDEVIMVCEKGEFRALYQAAKERWKEIGKRLSLQRFIEKHPGIDHKAGVPKGGTFILVYKENPPPKKKTLRLAEVAVPASTADQIRVTSAKAVAINAPVAAVSQLTNVDYTQFVEASVLKMKDYVSYYHPEFALEINKYLTYFFNPHLVLLNNDKIADKTVIADFFIPYICCSDGDAINFILAKEKEVVPPTEPKIGDFDYPDFNSEDFNTNRQ